MATLRSHLRESLPRSTTISFCADTVSGVQRICGKEGGACSRRVLFAPGSIVTTRRNRFTPRSPLLTFASRLSTRSRTSMRPNSPRKVLTEFAKNGAWTATVLDTVTVPVNGKPAYIYYVSGSQVNVLTPLDSSTGPVSVTVYNGTSTSAAFTANLQAVSPGFLRFGDGVHVA